MRRVVQNGAGSDPRPQSQTPGGGGEGAVSNVPCLVPREMCHAVVQAIDDVVFRLDRLGVITLLNPAWERTTGIPESDAVGRPLLDFIHPDDRRTHALQLHRLTSGTVAAVRLELRFMGRSGESCWLELNGRRTFDDDDFDGVAGTLHDVAGRKQMESTLALSELRFRAVFEHAAMAILVALPDGRILSTNPALERMLGFRDRELRGRHLGTLSTTEGSPSFESAVRGLGEGESDACRVEFRCISKRRHEQHALFHATLIRDDEQQPLLIVAMLEDLSERRASEMRLIRAKEEAEGAARLKSALLNNISHEVRTPLTTIIGYATILADEVPDEYRDFALTIARGGQRLLDTLNSVLELARLEADPGPISLSIVDVKREVTQALDLMPPLTDRKGLDLRSELPDEPVYVIADGPSLHRVLRNLLSNAVKFTNQGSVVVRVTPASNEVHIAVCDTGVGISDEFLPHLFDDFKQESSGLGRSHEGSGIGLSISRRLVALMGGSLQVSSRKGHGSTFTLTLQRAG